MFALLEISTFKALRKTPSEISAEKASILSKILGKILFAACIPCVDKPLTAVTAAVPVTFDKISSNSDKSSGTGIASVVAIVVDKLTKEFVVVLAPMSLVSHLLKPFIEELGNMPKKLLILS